jgi:hypothetical protein
MLLQDALITQHAVKVKGIVAQSNANITGAEQICVFLHAKKLSGKELLARPQTSPGVFLPCAELG